MTNKLKWRLSKLPTPMEVSDLVKDKIITQEEAREILFSQVDERDTESLEEEIKFLRNLVEKLSSNNRTQIIETIKTVQQPYWQYNWYKPYEVWCTSLNDSQSGTIYLSANSQNSSFTDINTF